MQETSLRHLVNRINMNEKFLKDHKENKEMLERKIEETKELIIQCVLQNKDNPLLDKISMKSWF